jgi:hypothetical protein
MSRITVARHAMSVGMYAVAFDELYTIVFWLILGRNARRAGPYAELKYFAIIGQLAIETTIILYLWEQRRKLQ